MKKEPDNPTPKKPLFHNVFIKLLESYQIADFAFVGVRVDSEKVWLWEAGNNESGDRDRINVLYAEIARLQNKMLNYSERASSNRRKVQDGI